MKHCIFGAGGFGRETLTCIIDIELANDGNSEPEVVFMVDDEFYTTDTIMNFPVIKRSEFDPKIYKVSVAIGDPKKRRAAVESLPQETVFATIIHPSAIISQWVTVGEGSIITAGVIATCGISIGDHTHLNLQTTIGHDCKIGDYFTTAPGTNISGNCTFGDNVYFGTNASAKDNIAICNDVIIGMGAVVVKEITEMGVYVGNPLRQLDI